MKDASPSSIEINNMPRIVLAYPTCESIVAAAVVLANPVEKLTSPPAQNPKRLGQTSRTDTGSAD